MPKPIAQRGFKVSSGDYFSNKGFCEYRIDSGGKEKIVIGKSRENRVVIWYDDGKVENVLLGTNQCERQFIFGKRSDCLSEGYASSDPDAETIRQQAESLYSEVKKILNVDEKLKDYKPRFSSISEINPFNVLDIENASELESIINKSKTEN